MDTTCDGLSITVDNLTAFIFKFANYRRKYLFVFVFVIDEQVLVWFFLLLFKRLSASETLFLFSFLFC